MKTKLVMTSVAVLIAASMLFSPHALAENAFNGGVMSVATGQAGTLREAVDLLCKKDYQAISALTVSGDIDREDFAFIGENLKKLKVLDLNEAVLCDTLMGDDKFYANLDSVLLPKAAQSGYDIGALTFYGQEGITQIIIPEGVSEIGQEAFSGCLSLSSVTFPSTLTQIGDGAFMFCASLKEVRLPHSLRGIGSNAFAGCESLESVVCLASEGSVQIAEDAFEGCELFERIAYKAEEKEKEEEKKEEDKAASSQAPNSVNSGHAGTLLSAAAAVEDTPYAAPDAPASNVKTKKAKIRPKALAAEVDEPQAPQEPQAPLQVHPEAEFGRSSDSGQSPAPGGAAVKNAGKSAGFLRASAKAAMVKETANNDIPAYIWWGGASVSIAAVGALLTLTMRKRARTKYTRAKYAWVRLFESI